MTLIIKKGRRFGQNIAQIIKLYQLARFGLIRVPNNEMNVKIFQIIKLNRIICPSLPSRINPRKYGSFSFVAEFIYHVLQ